MNFSVYPEPELIFGSGRHICPRAGISTHGVYDLNLDVRKSELLIGVLGLESGIELFMSWLEKCKTFIPTSATSRQPAMDVAFPGFNKERAFHCTALCSTEITRILLAKEVADVLAIKDFGERVTEASKLFYDHCRFLSKDKKVDVVVCIMPESFERRLIVDDYASNESEEEDEPETNNPATEFNLRRLLKAKCMDLDAPIQIIREAVLSGKRGSQPEATRAWNFFTALYYKGLQTIPWKLDRDLNDTPSCYVGVSFYASRDRRVIRSSLAQVFNENGNGIILRGTPVKYDKDNDRIPHLTGQQAHDLLNDALSHYRFAVGTVPGRLVLHKTSRFFEDEIEGFEQAVAHFGIRAFDFISLDRTDLRLYRWGAYPPNRGSALNLSPQESLLYTKGSVAHYRTYPGLYAPSPFRVNVVRRASSDNRIIREILGLTKMNWNNTQVDGKQPITVGCARRVGEIMKYVAEGADLQTKYAYFM